MRFRISALWGAMILAAGLVWAAGNQKYVVSFDADTPGSPPAWMRFESTNGLSTGKWKVFPNANPHSPPNVLVQTDHKGEAGQYRFGFSTEAGVFKNGGSAVSIVPSHARTECRGGAVLRYRDAGNFLAAIDDFKTHTVSLIEFHDGKKEVLGSVNAVSRERIWTTVGLEARGKDVTVTVGGQPVLHERAKHDDEGMAGLLAEGGSIEVFDDLTVTKE